MTLTDKSKHPIKAAQRIKTRVISTIASATSSYTSGITTTTTTTKTSATKIKEFTHEPEEIDDITQNLADTDVNNENGSSDMIEQHYLLMDFVTRVKIVELNVQYAIMMMINQFLIIDQIYNYNACNGERRMEC